MKISTVLFVIFIFTTATFAKDAYINPSIGINSGHGGNGALSLILGDFFTIDAKCGTMASSIGVGGGLYAMPYYGIGGGGTISYIRSYGTSDYAYRNNFVPNLDGVAVNGVFIFAMGQVELGGIYYPSAPGKNAHFYGGISLNFWWLFE